MNGLRFFLLFPIVLFWTISLYLSDSLFTDGYIQIVNAIIVGLFFAFGLFSFIVLIKFKYFFQRDAKLSESPQNASNTLKYFWTVLIVVVLLVISTVAISRHVNPPITVENDIVEISGTLNELPEYSHGGKSSSEIDFRINEFPQILFVLPFADYFHFQTTIEKDFQVDDSIFFTIQIDDFHGYITQDKELSFVQKYLGHNVISVSTIRSDSKNYLTLSAFNQMNNYDAGFTIVFILFVLLLSILIFQNIWKVEISKYLIKNRLYRTKAFLDRINRKK